MRKFRLVEVTDHDVFYGFLVVENEDITQEEIQQKINEIKCSEEDIFLESNWTVEDVAERMPENWGVWYEDTHNQEILFI